MSPFVLLGYGGALAADVLLVGFALLAVWYVRTALIGSARPPEPRRQGDDE